MVLLPETNSPGCMARSCLSSPSLHWRLLGLVRMAGLTLLALAASATASHAGQQPPMQEPVSQAEDNFLKDLLICQQCALSLRDHSSKQFLENIGAVNSMLDRGLRIIPALPQGRIEKALYPLLSAVAVGSFFLLGIAELVFFSGELTGWTGALNISLWTAWGAGCISLIYYGVWAKLIRQYQRTVRILLAASGGRR